MLAVGYAAVAGTWVLVSDRLTDLMFGDDIRQTLLVQTLKGLGFVAVTAGGLFFVVWWLLRRHEATSLAAARLARELVALKSRTGEGIWHLDTDGVTRSVNPRMAAMLGREPEALRGRPLVDFVAPAYAGRLDAQLAAWAADEGGPADLPLLRPDGSILWALAQGFPRAEMPGRTDGIALLLSDVTERKRTEEELRLRQSALEAASNGVVIVDPRRPDDPIVYVNPAFEAMTGYSADEVLGRNCRLLQGEDRDQSAREELRAAVAEGRNTVVEIRNYRRDGTMFWNEVRISPVRDGTGATTHFVGIQSDVTERRKARQRLEVLAYRDPLTGLLNRQAFIAALAARLADAARDDLATTIAVCDLDRLRDINQTRGNAAGDRVLVAVAERLRLTLGPDAVVARLGSGAFAGVLESVPDAPQARAEALRDCLLVPHRLPGDTLVVGAGVGLAVGEPGITAAELMQRADTALFAAKEQGRGSAAVYNEALDRRNRSRIAITEALRTAIADSQLELFFQPKIALADGTTAGAEALMRWRHPTDGLRSPASFIPVAEESGLIVEMGAWALEAAIERLVDWSGGPLGTLTMAVNVSERQLVDDSLADRLAALLRDRSCPGERLTLELTESLLMSDHSRFVQRLNRLRDLGVRLAIDDFGTGYASIGYLQRFPVDELKIDRRFVAGLETDYHDQALVEMMAGLGGRFGLAVTAEGVETSGQRDAVAAAGCTYAQGYYFAPPLPANAFDALVGAGPVRPQDAAGGTSRSALGVGAALGAPTS